MEGSSVLIVDDHLDNGEFFAEVAKLEGHDVRVATDGLEGFRMADRSWPDMILLDLGLPVLDGFQVARMIRILECTRSRPLIIAVTGMSQEGCAKAIEAGCDECLQKPVSADTLHALFQWLRKWGPRLPPPEVLRGE
jgi:CheY-like chemotaxis protein